MGCWLNPHKKLQFIFFAVLLYLFDFSGVLELRLLKLFIADMFEGQTELYILFRDSGSEFGFSLTLFGLLEIGVFRLE